MTTTCRGSSSQPDVCLPRLMRLYEEAAGGRTGDPGRTAAGATRAAAAPALTGPIGGG